ncbi:M48 family metallopeptidase [Actinoplanes aureus]|uniref:M48 family metalloprotease n=1 Tax=Actinoplanes aureus TaxID=2792083 RepID=A0A931CMH6_9ACTN|nr:M48 family metallopeptidase [Actinoplanes aureus]MBG0567640.1 M48 family metalloprotease [Actinoplanes aureus]
MSNGARAARVSAAALAGFLLVAGLQLAVVLLVLWTALTLLPSAVALRAGVPLSIATFGAAGYATWRALHTRRRVPAGVAVTRDDAPRLWELADKAAGAAGVRPPDSLTVVADATAVLGERTRLLGLIGGRRDLYLGLPLLMAWDPDRLRAVVAHELAHTSPRLSRWAPVAYRGRVAVSRIVPRISRRNPAGAVLRAYAGWYRRIEAPFSRAQELAADRIAAEHAGVAPAVAALRDLPALAGMQRLFHAEYLGPGWQAGYVPDDVFGGLLRVLAARAVELTRLRAQDPEPSGPWDPHPPLGERLAALAPSPDGEEPAEAGEPAVAENAEPAEELVPDLPKLGRALQAVAFPPGGRTVVSWSEFLSLARTAEMEREAEATLATISRAVGAPVPGPERVLELAGDGRLREAAGTLFPDLSPEETTGRVVDLLGLMLALAALRSGVVRWRHSWTGAAEVVGVDGAYLNLAELAVAAADPATTQSVREYLEKIGVDLAAPAGGAGPARAQVLGGLVNLSADGKRTDLLITDLGLYLVPGLPRGRTAEARRRLGRIAAAGIPASASTPADADGRFLPFVDVASLTTKPGRRRGWVIGLRDGGSVTLRPALDTEELPGGWSAWEDAAAFLSGTR